MFVYGPFWVILSTIVTPARPALRDRRERDVGHVMRRQACASYSSPFIVVATIISAVLHHAQSPSTRDSSGPQDNGVTRRGHWTCSLWSRVHPPVACVEASAGVPIGNGSGFAVAGR